MKESTRVRLSEESKNLQKMGPEIKKRKNAKLTKEWERERDKGSNRAAKKQATAVLKTGKAT